MSVLDKFLDAIRLNDDYEEEDQEILSAIACHTTGKSAMNPLEQIVFIADYIEPNRKMIPGLIEVRKMAFEDLDACMAEILCDTLKYRSRVGGPLDPSTQLAYEFYRQYQKEQTDPV